MSSFTSNTRPWTHFMISLSTDRSYLLIFFSSSLSIKNDSFLLLLLYCDRDNKVHQLFALLLLSPLKSPITPFYLFPCLPPSSTLNSSSSFFYLLTKNHTLSSPIIFVQRGLFLNQYVTHTHTHTHTQHALGYLSFASTTDFIINSSCFFDYSSVHKFSFISQTASRRPSPPTSSATQVYSDIRTSLIFLVHRIQANEVLLRMRDLRGRSRNNKVSRNRSPMAHSQIYIQWKQARFFFRYGIPFLLSYPA